MAGQPKRRATRREASNKARTYDPSSSMDEGRGNAKGNRSWRNDPELVQKYIRASRMRTAGATYREIAEALGFADRSGAYYAVQCINDDLVAENAEELRQIEATRLDRLLMASWPAATRTNPDARAAEIVLRIIEKRTRLFRLNAPDKVDITATIRQMAERDGLDPELAVAEAEEIIRVMD